MNQELCEISNLLLNELRENYPSNVFSIWFQSLKLKALTEDEAVLTIDNDFKKKIVESKHIETLTNIISNTIGFSVKVRLEVENTTDDFSIPDFPEKKVQEEPSAFEVKPATPLKPHIIEGSDIVEEYTFDNFIVGDSNKFAHTAAQAVAKSPFDVYNPLFIHGASGLGKTHLLYAITNELKKNNPKVKILFKKCEEFLNELIENLLSGDRNKTVAFRETCRSVDVLLIDDIQFIAGKESTQIEFFNLFNDLYEHKKQIILTSDRPPRDIKQLEERLRTRFEWGLIADIQKPNIELRTAIVQKKNEDYGLEMPKEVIDFLAASIHSNIRQIEGAIKKIGAISRMTDSPITMNMARRAIADILANSVSTTDMIERIFNLVSAKYHIPVEDIKGKKRDAPIANARHLCIYLIRQMNELTQKQIADLFSKDHATIVSSIKKIKNEIDTNEEKRKEIDELIKEIGMK